MTAWLGNEKVLSATLHSRRRHPLAPRLPEASKEETAAFWYTPEGRHRVPDVPIPELPTALDATLPPSILLPERVGTVSGDGKQVVWQFFRRIAERWHTTASMALTPTR